MHDNEVTIDEAGVRSLVSDQFPAWAVLPLTKVVSAGTDNTIWRLGDELALRFPRSEGAAQQPMRDHHLLPVLAGLPIDVPTAVAIGQPGADFPFQWAVQTWVPGELAAPQTVPDRLVMARDLGGFIRDLRARPIHPDFVVQPDGPGRGGSLGLRATETRSAIQDLADVLDAGRLLALWEQALAQPRHEGPPRWFHGDLHVANLIARDGRLAGVIDWGAAGAGDPAIDLLPAWWIFDAETRAAFLAETGSDSTMIARGRGWALSVAAIALAYYRGGRNPVFAGMSENALAEILAE